MCDTQHQSPLGVNKLYFAVWRWHFYSAIYVVPFLLMLAITGIFMVWFTAISPEYGERLALTPQATTLGISDQVNAALAVHPDGKICQYIAPYSPTNPAMFRVDLEGSQRMIAVTPYTGEIL